MSLRSSLVTVGALAALAAPGTADPVDPVAPAVTIGGYLETYYQYSLARPPVSSAPVRFEPRLGSFTIASAVVQAAVTAAGWHATLGLQAGDSPAVFYGSEPERATWQHVREASAGAEVGGAVTVDAGLFLSPIGPESLASHDDYTWSRSTLFVALPFYHLGVRASRPLGGGVTAQAWLVNGWNSAVDGNRWKTVMLAAAYARGATTGQVLYAGGVERPTADPAGAPWRHLIDLYVARAVTDALDVMVHVDGGREAGADGGHRWLAGALYVRARPRPALEVAARLDGVREWVDAGVAPLLLGVERVIAGTATVSWRAAPHLLGRVELRHDRASAAVLPGATAPRADQTTLTAAVTAWF